MRPGTDASESGHSQREDVAAGAPCRWLPPNRARWDSHANRDRLALDGPFRPLSLRDYCPEAADRARPTDTLSVDKRGIETKNVSSAFLLISGILAVWTRTPAPKPLRIPTQEHGQDNATWKRQGLLMTSPLPAHPMLTSASWRCLEDGVANIDMTQNIKEYIMANTVKCLI
ncbi:hypothetical protein HPB47_009345 [Ixodes persulcatus]|uniref:Uncharacterized protein n=1 Tax=Ixodes persulcatus TaxID=34615 RepID=A0AC60P262_IXOPE|nr:hypothetical protein HPB47_009345 [Ixodes persulcatus]